jgi:hypothetical protein
MVAEPLVHLHGVCHPLLAETALPPLPEPPAAMDVIMNTSPGKLGSFKPMDVAKFEAVAEAARNVGKAQKVSKEGKHRVALMPQPVDLRVPTQARVVAVTGPNTGGKTAALKTLGISVLMAQAGMHLRLAGDADRLAAGAAVTAEAPRVCTMEHITAFLPAHVMMEDAAGDV